MVLDKTTLGCDYRATCVIAKYTPKAVSITFSKSDVVTLYNIIKADMDGSGIIDHILDELGVDFWSEDDV